MNNILKGDCLIELKKLKDNSVDSIVTDPPYELGFMGKTWDSTGIAFNVEVWKECLRVLKPGGHLLSFSGSRTYHRMAVAIEDAGFEIRDQIMWVYGSGFPKSHNISKGLDKNENKEVWENNQYGGGNSKCEKCGKWMISGSPCQCPKPVIEFKSEAAKQWDGWGTALKPAHEPIVLARKPLIGTVANNVLTYGTGGLNIDGARVGTTVETWPKSRSYPYGGDVTYGSKDAPTELTQEAPAGRWPANFIHDGSDEVVALFPDSKGALAPVKSGQKGFGGEIYNKYKTAGDDGATFYNDGDGSAARFFYCAKASKRDRNEGLDGFEEVQITGGGGLTAELREDGSLETASADGKYGSIKAKKANHHPTVKPTTLMQYLITLVTPKGGIVLDPFLGSGSTAKAAVLSGFKWIGCEITPEYWPIIEARVAWAKKNKGKPKTKKKVTKKKSAPTVTNMTIDGGE